MRSCRRATAVAVGELGGLGVLNAEGLWARHANVPDALFRLIRAAEDFEDPNALVRVLQELHVRADPDGPAHRGDQAGALSPA